MKELGLIFPHQLFDDLPWDTDLPIVMVEEHLFFRQYAFHKQKLVFHRASMRAYADRLSDSGYEVEYLDCRSDHNDIRDLIAALAERKVERVHYMDPCDDWLEKRLQAKCRDHDISLKEYASPMWLNTKDELSDFFRSDKKKFFQTTWYKDERKRRGILLTQDGGPQGGDWTYDKENRKKYPKSKTPPSISFPDSDSYFKEAKSYVEEHFADNPGEVQDTPLYPHDREGALKWLKKFLEHRFHEFGPYEDAIVKDASILHHSVLTPMLNVGLISPQEVLDKALEYAAEHDVPINSTEGFVRQIIGWREFIRGVYIAKGVEERTKNFWGFERKIPESFYTGETGILPVDNVIRKVLKTGYCHHIERLMVLANFMLLCEFDPDEVYRWFMELFIDAYDWVMVPNVYGMSQFADGGLMSTKPYISSSNYLMKMSDYPKGEWQETWDGLFWRFMHVHRDFFASNPRLNMLLSNLDKMGKDTLNDHLERADTFLESL
ncbi:MAG: cryptochrome/photolyase family protein [Flavobacteriales bacterium]|nr:cryptochrome/photolyase family protein [Flavobacteriales bacterium]